MSGALARAGRTVAARPPLLIALGVLTAALFVASLALGSADLALGRAVVEAFSPDPGAAGLILREIRLPRAVLAAAIGATLGLGGAALQGYLRNPLAEPGLLGISASASFAAVIVFYSGLAASHALALPAAAMGGALVAVVLLLALAGRGAGPLTLILAGVAVNSLAGALTALALTLAPSPFAIVEALFWLFGSLADRSLVHVAIALPFMVLGWLMLAGLGRPLDALALGDDTAASLGIDVARVRLRLVLGVAVSVGAATSVAGAIGFVGLVVPHLLRPLVGYAPAALLPASALGGAALLLAADIAVRLVPTAPELKLGVVTALLGAPFFLALVLKARGVER